MTPPEATLLRRGLIATERCAARLQRSLNRLQALFPIVAESLQSLSLKNSRGAGGR